MEAEHSFGNWLEKSGRREEVVILSKCGHPDAMWNKRVNEKEMRKDLKKSLEELKTDYIDIYMLHRDDPDTEVAVAVETFNAMHEEGNIGAFGASNWTHTRIEEANEYAYKQFDPVFRVQPEFLSGQTDRRSVGWRMCQYLWSGEYRGQSMV